MAENPPLPEATARATVGLTIQGVQFQARMTVPAGPATPGRLLPVFRRLAESIVSVGVEAVEGAGRKVTCSKGCGACCRQLVPITRTEAHALRELIERLPEPRRVEIRRRFAEAARRLDAAGWLDRLLSPRPLDGGVTDRFGLDYFALGIACPFLEDEACSIYEERPISCREYLVTSDPVHCSKPSPETVACVPVASRVSNALGRLEAGGEIGPDEPFWIPLIVAPRWAERLPPETAERTGLELLKDLLGRLEGEK